MIKKINKKDFLKLLAKHPLEDVLTIKCIENTLKLKRKYVVKMPKKGSEVIHLLSGGIDSISSWILLMEEYGLKVHPVCIDNGQKRHSEERKSIDYYSNLLKRLYPDLYVAPFHLTFPTSSPEISKSLRGNLKKTIHPQVLLDNFDSKTNTVTLTRKYLFPAFYPFPAALAALFFELKKNIKIRTIFCSVLPTDGLYNSSQTLTALRAAMLSLCAFTNDYSWQIISLCFEKELGLLLNKPDLINWTNKHNIPIEYAYTCLKGERNHCGECIACTVRKESFIKAKVKDKTVYLKNSKKNLKEMIRHSIKSLKFVYNPLWNWIKSRKIMMKIVIKDYY